MLKYFIPVLAVLSVLFILSCSEEKLSIGKQVPHLMVSSMTGDRVSLTRKGVELVEFWQNGCAACLKVMGELNEFALQNDIKIYAINSIDSLKIIEEHAKNHPYESIQFVQDKQNITWHRYELFAVPTLIIVKDGVYVDRVLGDRGINFIREKIKKHL